MLVALGVVVAAHWSEVVDGGRSVFSPGLGVVEIRLSGRCAASGEDAGAAEGFDYPSLVGGGSTAIRFWFVVW